MSPRSSADHPTTRILFLAANPDSTAPLHAGREVRRIRDRLAGTRYQSALEIIERWAVRPSDLQQALIEVEPHIVHFSGHGSAEYELMLEGDDGSPRPIGKAVLAELFRLRGAGVRAVVLSACHSLPQAEAIAEHVDCAIGMRRAIGSEAATEFSAALYHAVGSGDSIPRAFESARLHLEATGIPEHRTPVLVVVRDDVNLERSLVRRAPAAALPHEQILRLHAAAVSSQLPASRAALLGGIDPSFVDGLPLCKSEIGQILSDLHGLNAAARSSDSELPLRIWLGNALALAGQGADAHVFRSALRAIAATEDVTRPAAPQEGDDIADELSRIGRLALLAASARQLLRSLCEVESLLARAPHHVEARLLRERILRALPAPERGSFGCGSPALYRESLLDEPPNLSADSRSSPTDELDDEIVRRWATGAWHGGAQTPETILPATPRAPHGIFIGRERELLELTSQLGGAGALICGLGGMGKTALARAIMPTLARRYPDLQIAIDLQGTSGEPLSPAAAMAHVTRAFLPGVPLPSSLEELTKLYRALLEGQRALIFLEDAKDKAQVEPLLPPDGSALIITSRQRFTLPGVHVLSLDRLPPESALDLLESYVPALDRGMASKLAEACGGVPLALRLAGSALLKRPDLTPEVYLNRLLDAQSRHDLLEAALRVSVSLLDPILQIVWSGLDVFPSGFRSDAVRIKGRLLRAEVSELVDHGMLDYDPDTALYRLPRSGRRLAIPGLTEADRVMAEQQLTELIEGMRDGEPSTPQAITLEPSRLEAAQRAARRCGYRSAEALYIEATADRLRDQPPASRLMEQALVIYRELGDQSAEVRILGKLFLLYERSDERRAVEFGEQALVLLHERGERREESLLLRKVYALHRRLKNERRAVELCERDVAIYSELAIPWAEGMALATLAKLHEELGDDRRAVEVHEQCLAMAREKGSQGEVARGAYRISLIYRRLREFDKAIAALSVCVDAVRAIGWAPGAASTALGRSAEESLEVELSRLRASRTT